jgi:hypothetical protein
MKSKMSLDLNMINTILMVIILIVVVYCCVKKQNEAFSDLAGAPIMWRKCSDDKENPCKAVPNESESCGWDGKQMDHSVRAKGLAACAMMMRNSKTAFGDKALADDILAQLKDDALTNAEMDKILQSKMVGTGLNCYIDGELTDIKTNGDKIDKCTWRDPKATNSVLIKRAEKIEDYNQCRDIAKKDPETNRKEKEYWDNDELSKDDYEEKVNKLYDEYNSANQRDNGTWYQVTKSSNDSSSAGGQEACSTYKPDLLKKP